ncbi:hypothetical protein WBJ53_11960 [Spirosoma sp. SC4-14]|uniref:hypothetical protein n=1 Tax=Spirosoma sp. SC4-14 TaxID=3128900 RepID=UPI0030D5E465
MLAQLRIDQTNETTRFELQTSGISQHLPVQPTSGIHWQLAATNLTTGKLMDLLMCLDELGFSVVETNS